MWHDDRTSLPFLFPVIFIDFAYLYQASAPCTPNPTPVSATACTSNLRPGILITPPVKCFNYTPPPKKKKKKKSKVNSNLFTQVSILVRPAAGGNAVLLNVPRSVAAKVEKLVKLISNNLSGFSWSTDLSVFCVGEAGHHPLLLCKQWTKVHGESKMKTK